MHRGIIQDGRQRRSRVRVYGLLIALGALVVAGCSSSLNQSSLNPQSVETEQIDQLWRLVLVLATLVFVVVEAALVVSIIKWRKRPGDDTEPKQTHGNTSLEIAWTIVPAVILAVLAVPTLQTLFDLRAPAEGPDVVTVEVVGHQWWWEFRYPDLTGPGGRPLTTANELHIPAGRTTNLVMTSADVLHSFWVPALAGKRDLVPGRPTEIKITPNEDAVGVHNGQCAEFCWLGHADMRVQVVVESQQDYEAWVADQLEPAQVPTSGPAVGGFETFTQLCTACHQALVQGEAGPEVVGTAIGPDLTHFGSRRMLGSAILENTPEHLALWIDSPESVKAMAPELNDLAEGLVLGMPDYGLDPEQIAALVELLEGWK